MNFATKKNVSMMIFGFLLAMFIVYGNVSLFAEPFNRLCGNNSTYYSYYYFIKLLVAATLLLLVSDQRKFGIICAGLIVALAVIAFVMLLGLRSNNLGLGIASVAFSALILASHCFYVVESRESIASARRNIVHHPTLWQCCSQCCRWE